MLRCADVVLGRDAKVKVTWEGARKETETCLNVCIQHVLNRTGIKAKQVTTRPPGAWPLALITEHLTCLVPAWAS